MVWAYQIIKHKVLGTYRLQDSNGKPMAALIHRNRLIQANIRTADELRNLRAPEGVRTALRQRNRQLELVPSESENTSSSEHHLMELDAMNLI